MQKWGIFVLLVLNLASESTTVVDNDLWFFPPNKQIKWLCHIRCFCNYVVNINIRKTSQMTRGKHILITIMAVCDQFWNVHKQNQPSLLQNWLPRLWERFSDTHKDKHRYQTGLPPLYKAQSQDQSWRKGDCYKPFTKIMT